MPKTLQNYTKTGSVIPRGDRLQEPVDSIREIWDYLASLGNVEPYEPQERFTATIISGFPTTNISLGSSGQSPDYVDARYCMVRVLTLGSNVNDLPGINVDQEAVSAGIGDSVYFTATNLVELLNNTHGLATDGSVTVEVFATFDVGSPQQKHYYFVASPEVAWIKLTSIVASSSGGSNTGGGGFYNARLMTGVPVTINPSGDLLIPAAFPREIVPGTDNILAENSLEANFGDPPIHLMPLPCFVPAWLVGYSSETPPRPVYRFGVMGRTNVTVMLTANDTAYGEYTGNIISGWGSTAAVGSNFISSTNTYPDGLPAGSPCLACCLDEINQQSWKTAVNNPYLGIPPYSYTTLQLVTGNIVGVTATTAALPIVFFGGGLGVAGGFSGFGIDGYYNIDAPNSGDPAGGQAWGTVGFDQAATRTAGQPITGVGPIFTFLTQNNTITTAYGDAKGHLIFLANSGAPGPGPTGSAGGDLSGSYPNPTVSKVNGTALGTTSASAGYMMIGNGSTISSVAMSGDGTLNGSGALVVTKTNGVAFAASATTDTTNASNITSGNLDCGTY